VRLDFSNQSPRSPAFSGPYASNPPAAHIPPLAPASPMKQPWQEASYRGAGGTVPPPYVTAEPQSSPTTRTTGGEPLPISSSLAVRNRESNSGVSKGHVPSHFNRSSSTSSTSNSHQTRFNLPRLGCKLPHCDKPALFDQHINEQREYCEEHIGYVLNKDMFSYESSSLNVFVAVRSLLDLHVAAGCAEKCLLVLTPSSAVKPAAI